MSKTSIVGVEGSGKAVMKICRVNFRNKTNEQVGELGGLTFLNYAGVNGKLLYEEFKL